MNTRIARIAGLSTLMATAAADVLGAASTTAPLAVDPLAPAPTPAPTEAPADPNTFQFKIPNTETNIAINIAEVPASVRMDFLQKGLRDYIINSVNQANIRTNKANEAFTAYDAATKADPMQTAVTKPAGEPAVADLVKVAADARGRLYKGEVRKQGDGTGTKRETIDPLTKLVTDAVVRELFAKGKESGSKQKYTDVTAEVSKAGGGIKYLEAKIAEKVATGADEAVLRKFLDERYIKPAQMMLGTKTNKATDAANSIL